MRKGLLGATCLAAIGLVGAASPAFAGPGQCYDAYGRRVGPVYDTDRPNYGFINSIIRRGGSCTGVVSPPSRPQYNYYGRGYRNDGYRYDDRYRYNEGYRYRYDSPYDPYRGYQPPERSR